MANVFQSFIVLLSVFSSGCTDNTGVGKNFKADEFYKIENGEEISQVATRIGNATSKYSNIEFGESGSDNFPGLVKKEDFPGAKQIRYVYVYSYPKNVRRDYRVFEVFVDPDTGRVLGKQSYETD